MNEVIIRTKRDIPLAIYYTLQLLRDLNFSKYEEQQVLVSVSELTNNVLKHSGVEGVFRCCSMNKDKIHIFVSDQGKGIEDVASILEGESTIPSSGMGLGLRGVKKLMDEFSINAQLGKGVTVLAMKKKNTTNHPLSIDHRLQ
jgi:serine/threonine-protein kinase RsbT